MHKTVVAELRGEVNQGNVSSRLDAVDPGPESAVFQLLSKSMCSRYGYQSRSKSPADRIITCLTQLSEAATLFVN